MQPPVQILPFDSRHPPVRRELHCSESQMGFVRQEWCLLPGAGLLLPQSGTGAGGKRLSWYRKWRFSHSPVCFVPDPMRFGDSHRRFPIVVPPGIAMQDYSSSRRCGYHPAAGASDTSSEQRQMQQMRHHRNQKRGKRWHSSGVWLHRKQSWSDDGSHIKIWLAVRHAEIPENCHSPGKIPSVHCAEQPLFPSRRMPLSVLSAFSERLLPLPIGCCGAGCPAAVRFRVFSWEIPFKNGALRRQALLQVLQFVRGWRR